MARPDAARMVILLAIALAAVTFVRNLVTGPSSPPEGEPGPAYYALQAPYDLGLLLLCALAWRNARSLRDEARLPATLLALALWGFTLGDWTWLAYNFAGVDAPYPSLADLGYLAFPIAATAGLLTLFRQHRHRLQGIDLALAVVFPLAVAALLYTLLLAGRIGTEDALLLEVLNIVYPTADAVFVAFAGLLLLFSRPSAYTPALRRVAAGLVGLAAADIVFIYTTIHELYFTGSWVDQIYILVMIGYGLAIVRFRPEPAGGRHHRQGAPA